jgi:hypothetical protein
VQRDQVALSTTYQTTQTSTQPKVMNVQKGENHGPIQPLDEVVFARQPW